jgi:hypothetical protein
VRAAHANGLVAVAISSWDRNYSRCWRPQDVAPAIAIVEVMRKRLGLEGKSSFALGASSGGGFTGMLASRCPPGTLTAISSQIMPLSDHFFSVAQPRTAVEFVTMPKDEPTEHFVRENIRSAANLNLLHQARHCLPLPITPTLFSDRAAAGGVPADPASSARISTAASAAVRRALGSAGLLDSATGLLFEDPRQSNWREVVSASSAAAAAHGLPMDPDQSALSEIMNVAWAQHEFCATDIQKTFDFFHEAAAAATAAAAAAAAAAA